MNIERYISVYSKKEEQLLKETRIDELILFDNLKKIFRPYKNDPLLYMVYEITPNRAERLKKILNLEFDMDNLIYQLDCYQVE